MPRTLDPNLRRSIADRARYYKELATSDLYRHPGAEAYDDNSASVARAPSPAAVVVGEEQNLSATTKLESPLADPASSLRLIREDLGDCTRCRLHKQGRKQIVFGVGNPNADLMFIGEAPGADEDEQGEPFVGRAGQLLNKMIKAMGIHPEDVCIANVIK